MADIELVIKIDEELYNYMQTDEYDKHLDKRFDYQIRLAVKNGTPLEEELHREKEQAYYLGYEERGKQNVEEAITRYKNNAEYERTHGNLQGCLEFKQLVKWLEKYQKMQEVLDKVWNVPSCMLDEAECLNKIMETYRTVR